MSRLPIKFYRLWTITSFIIHNPGVGKLEDVLGLLAPKRAFLVRFTAWLLQENFHNAVSGQVPDCIRELETAGHCFFASVSCEGGLGG
jgi:hypothetical protein